MCSTRPFLFSAQTRKNWRGKHSVAVSILTALDWRITATADRSFNSTRLLIFAQRLWMDERPHLHFSIPFFLENSRRTCSQVVPGALTSLCPLLHWAARSDFTQWGRDPPITVGCLPFTGHVFDAQTNPDTGKRLRYVFWAGVTNDVCHHFVFFSFRALYHLLEAAPPFTDAVQTPDS